MQPPPRACAPGGVQVVWQADQRVAAQLLVLIRLQQQAEAAEAAAAGGGGGEGSGL